MRKIQLEPMTQELVRQYYRKYEPDPDLFMDLSLMRPYEYSDAKADGYLERQRQLGRIYLAVMLEREPIGEILLKDLDPVSGCCMLSIHLANDSVKNQGFGTQAEILALKFAFEELSMNTVYADAVLKNRRSQHVLEKVGFLRTHQDPYISVLPV